MNEKLLVKLVKAMIRNLNASEKTFKRPIIDKVFFNKTASSSTKLSTIADIVNAPSNVHDFNMVKTYISKAFQANKRADELAAKLDNVKQPTAVKNSIDYVNQNEVRQYEKAKFKGEAVDRSHVESLEKDIYGNATKQVYKKFLTQEIGKEPISTLKHPIADEVINSYWKKRERLVESKDFDTRFRDFQIKFWKNKDIKKDTWRVGDASNNWDNPHILAKIIEKNNPSNSVISLLTERMYQLAYSDFVSYAQNLGLDVDLYSDSNNSNSGSNNKTTNNTTINDDLNKLW